MKRLSSLDRLSVSEWYAEWIWTCMAALALALCWGWR